MNRRNSQLSTGPRSEAGKLAVSLNATKFGLFSRDRLLLESESPEQFEAFAEDLREDLDPTGPLENLLTDKVIWAAWRLQRLLNMERRLFEQPGELLPTNQTTEGMLVDPAILKIDFVCADEEENDDQTHYLNTKTGEISTDQPKPEEARSAQNILTKIRNSGLNQFDIDLIAAEADKFGLRSEEIFARYLVNAYSPASGPRGKEPLQLLARYEASLEKSFYRAIQELREVQWRRYGVSKKNRF